jgi:hypothetical protein
LPADGGIDLVEFVLRAGQADLESFNLPEPAFPVGLDDPGL